MRRLAVALLALAAAAAAQTEPVDKKWTWLAAAAGATAGALVGTRGLSFAQVPGYARRGHEWRAGATYGSIGAALAAAGALRLEGEPAEPHRFWVDRWNTPLFAGIATVQALDFASTRYFRDRGKDEYLLTNALVDNRPKFVATEVAAAGAGIALSYVFHRTGHHKLERWAAAAYIAFGTASAVANYRYPATGHGLFN